MQVLVLGEDVLVAEAPVADRTLVRLLADVRQSHVPDQPVLVAELLAAYASQRARAAGELQQVAKENLDERPHRIASATVTPAPDESILKPRFRRDALPLRTSLQPRAIAYTVYYYYYFFFNPSTQFPGNEKITLYNTEKYKNQAGMNLTLPSPSQNSHALMAL